MPYAKSLREAFERGCPDRPDDDHWIWRGPFAADGQTRLNWRSRVGSALRVAYELFVGEVPEGGRVRRSCDRRDCVNPAHAWLAGIHCDHGPEDRREYRNRTGRRAVQRYCIGCFRDRYNK